MNYLRTGVSVKKAHTVEHGLWLSRGAEVIAGWLPIRILCRLPWVDHLLYASQNGV